MSTRREFVKSAALTAASLALTSGCGRSRGPAATADDAFQTFRASIGGRIILPADPEYDKARRVAWWNPAMDKRPAMLVQCERDDDVARCIEFARRQELKLAVRSGGHSFLGWGTGDGLVIDVSRIPLAHAGEGASFKSGVVA